MPLLGYLTLMNKVTEAKKAAEANLIVRREETAAMRSQANTAKLLEGKRDADAAPGVGGPGKGRRRRQAERRAGRERSGRAGRETALIFWIHLEARNAVWPPGSFGPSP
jgi:hypothetical protein